MYGPGLPIEGTFNLPRTTAGSGAFFALVTPFGSSPQYFPMPSAGINAKESRGRYKSHVTKVIYTTGGTAHIIYIARPLNFSVVAAAVAAGATNIPLADDPGVYSTNYKYASLNGSAPAQVADNAISSGDYIGVQLADGTWKAAQVTGGSYTGLTVAALPNNNSIGINKGALCYFFGNVSSDVDPATGQTQPQTQIASSQTRDASWADQQYGVVAALHPGDPLLFLSGNASAQGYLEHCGGFYSER